MPERNTWIEYRELVLQELETLNEKVDELEAKAHAHDLELNTIKIKWAVIAGVISLVSSIFSGVVIHLLVEYLKH